MPIEIQAFGVTYLSSNISSTESNVSICIGKAWIAIDRQVNNHMEIWSFWKNKTGILSSCNHVILFCIQNPGNCTSQNSSCITAGEANSLVMFSYGLIYMIHTHTHQCWLTSKNLYSSAMFGHWILSRVHSDGWQTNNLLLACLEDERWVWLSGPLKTQLIF